MTKKIYSERSRTTIKYLSIIIIVIGSIFLANGLILAWTPPSASPPDDNVSSPLNVGGTSQHKSGALGVGGAFRAYSSIKFDNYDGCSALETDADGDLVCGTDGGASCSDCDSRFVNVSGDTMTGNLTMPISGTISSPGRMHISGGELLYLLNTSGVVIGKEWGGNGNLSVQGNLNVGGSATAGYLYVNPQDGTNEGGEIQLKGAGSYAGFQIDNYQGNARIHTLGSDKQFQVLGGGASIAGNLNVGGNIQSKYLMTTDGTVTGGMFTYSSNHTLYIGAGNNDGNRHDIILYNLSCAQGSCNVPTIHLYGDTVSAKGNLNVSGDIAISDKHAFRGNDTWLRLNQDGAFASGVHTPGLFAPSALSVGIWSSPGANNAQVGGNFAVGNTVFARQGNSVELATDTTFGGVHDNHTGVRMFAYDMNGWTTAKLGIQVSNGWGSYGSVVAKFGEFGIWTKGTYSSPYCDIAELYEPSQSNDELEPGDIVVLDEEQEKKIKKSSQPYSTLIVGVVSTNPNMTMGLLEDNSNEEHPPVALLGRVPTKVTTENGPIKIGDLIVSSSKPGYGMKCDDYDKCQGAVVGKATENLESGEGLIEVLIKGGF